jgi:squalene synthase HpnC
VQIMAGDPAEHRCVEEGTDISDPAGLADKQRAENFPVALRVLPVRLREHLTAVYGFARTVDDLGDEADGDRLAGLAAFDKDLAKIWENDVPESPVLRRLKVTVDECDLPHAPFQRLVQANVQDQVVTRYPTFSDLQDYCVLSADPVGRIVLGVFGRSSPERVVRSDQVCTALQLVEHWQDVAEDRRAGRIYLPQEDLARFKVREFDLDGDVTPQALRTLLSFETDRAEALLDEGAPLVGMLGGWARVAVAGFVAGGYATVDALRRSRFDVLRNTPRPRKRDILRHTIRLLMRPEGAR